MTLSHITPAWLLMKSPEKFLVCHKAFTVGYETEFVRFMPQNIEHKAGQIMGLYLVSFRHAYCLLRFTSPNLLVTFKSVGI